MPAAGQMCLYASGRFPFATLSLLSLKARARGGDLGSPSRPPSGMLTWMLIARRGPSPSLRASAPTMAMDAQTRFRRAKLLDILETVTAKDVINVIGRWQSYKQWDSAGPLREMDQLFGALLPQLIALATLTHALKRPWQMRTGSPKSRCRLHTLPFLTRGG